MAPIRCCCDQTAVWHSDAARGPSTPSFKVNSAITVIGIDVGKELVSRGRPPQARRDHASAEVVARAGGGAAGQPAAVSNRHGGLRRGASSQPQATDARTRRSLDAGEVRAPVFQGAKE